MYVACFHDVFFYDLTMHVVRSRGHECQVQEVEEFDKVEKAHREKRVKLDWSEDGPQLGLVAVIVGLIDMEGTSIEEGLTQNA